VNNQPPPLNQLRGGAGQWSNRESLIVTLQDKETKTFLNRFI